MTQHKQSHRIKSHGRTSHQPTLHQNRSHHHHGTAEGSFTAKTWFGHRAGRSPCAHSIGKFFLCYIVLFSCETSAPGSPGNYLYTRWSFLKTTQHHFDKNPPKKCSAHLDVGCFDVVSHIFHAFKETLISPNGSSHELSTPPSTVTWPRAPHLTTFLACVCCMNQMHLSLRKEFLAKVGDWFPGFHMLSGSIIKN